MDAAAKIDAVRVVIDLDRHRERVGGPGFPARGSRDPLGRVAAGRPPTRLETSYREPHRRLCGEPSPEQQMRPQVIISPSLAALDREKGEQPMMATRNAIYAGASEDDELPTRATWHAGARMLAALPCLVITVR